MKKSRHPIEEYDFSGGVRGKYAGRVARGGSIVVLDPDVAKKFPNSKSVNQTLRALLRIFRRTKGA